MRQRHLPLALLSGLALCGLLACGGSSSTPNAAATSTPASTLVYTDPVGTGWRLVKDGTSTPTRLVLNLVGPSGTLTRGVGFNLQAAPGVRFAAFPNGLAVRDTGVYKLRSAGSTDLQEPVALVGGVKPGNLLSVGIYQKDRDQAAQDSGVPLCQIALQLDEGARLEAGTSLRLNVVKARAIPQDIGRVTDDLWTLGQKMRMTDLSIAVGALSAQ